MKSSLQNQEGNFVNIYNTSTNTHRDKKTNFPDFSASKNKTSKGNNFPLRNVSETHFPKNSKWKLKNFIPSFKKENLYLLTKKASISSTDKKENLKNKQISLYQKGNILSHSTDKMKIRRSSFDSSPSEFLAKTIFKIQKDRTISKCSDDELKNRADFNTYKFSFKKVNEFSRNSNNGKSISSNIDKRKTNYEDSLN